MDGENRKARGKCRKARLGRVGVRALFVGVEIALAFRNLSEIIIVYITHFTFFIFS